MSHPKQEAIVVAGFPGVGKTYLIPADKPSSLQSLIFQDLDSTPFSHKDGQPNPAFPENYITHIKTLLQTPDLIIMVGVHDVVRDQIVANGIRFTLVYPEQQLKDEYMERYTKRGSHPGLIKKLDQMWDAFTSSCAGQKDCRHVVLKSGEYLEDVMEGIVRDSAH